MIVPKKIADEAVTRAKELRKNATEAEMILWEILRDKKLIGTKFYRQRPVYYLVNDAISFLIADFCADEIKLIVEVDGGYHDEIEEKDQLRDNILEGLGYTIIHIKNYQLLKERQKTITILKTTIKELKKANV